MFRQPKGRVTKEYIKVYQARNSVIARLIVWTAIIILLMWFKNNIVEFFVKTFDLTLEPSVGVAYVLTLVLILIWVLVAASVYYMWRGSYYEVFPDRVIKHHGMKGDEVRAVKMSDFLGVNLEGSKLGDLLGYGTITFEYRIPRVEGSQVEVLHNIPNPEYYLEKIEELQGLQKRPKEED